VAQPLKLQLPNVTLVAIDHGAAYALTRWSLDRCLAAADFADVVILSDVDLLPGAHWIKTTADSPIAANMLLWYELPKHLLSTHFLYAQWDSWVINPDAWTDQFLAYDYIGAPWPMSTRPPPHNVGNGGFSLRSRALMDYVSRQHLNFHHPEDVGLCCYYRALLERQGFRWPEPRLAHRFSAEMVWPHGVTPFGFHGAYNFPAVMMPEEYEEIAALASPYVLGSDIWAHLQGLFAYIRAGHPTPTWCGPFQPGWDAWLKRAA
jgi:hypothetical protein